jgi:hypothetical protein
LGKKSRNSQDESKHSGAAKAAKVKTSDRGTPSKKCKKDENKYCVLHETDAHDTSECKALLRQAKQMHASWEASLFRQNKSAHKSENDNKETLEESNLIASKPHHKSHDKSKGHKHKDRAFDIDPEYMKAAIKQESFTTESTESTSSSSEEE